MNEWEWQLLEDKPAIDRVTVNGVEFKVGDRVCLPPAEGRRHPGCRAGREDRDH